MESCRGDFPSVPGDFGSCGEQRVASNHGRHGVIGPHLAHLVIAEWGELLVVPLSRSAVGQPLSVRTATGRIHSQRRIAARDQLLGRKEGVLRQAVGVDMLGRRAVADQHKGRHRLRGFGDEGGQGGGAVSQHLHGRVGLRGEDGLYAWAKAGDATVTVEDTGEFYPAGLANLFVVALGPSEWHDRRDTVLATYRRFPNMTGLSPDQLYWWIVAAQRVGRKDIALQAFESMKAKVQERDLAVDHAFYLRAIASLKHAHTAPKRTKVMMGSTYIDIPRAAVR